MASLRRLLYLAHNTILHDILNSLFLLMEKVLCNVLLLITVSLQVNISALGAQTPTIDSLRQVIQQQELNIDKVDNLLRINHYYSQVNMVESLEYAEEAFALSKELNYRKGQGRAYKIFALSDYFKGDYEAGLQNGTKAMEIAESENDQHGILSAANTMSAIYNLKAKNDKSIEYLLFGYKAAQELNDSISMVKLLQNLGYLHNEEGNVTEATKYYKQILKFQPHQGSSSEFKLTVYHGSAIYHRNVDEYDEAIKLFSMGIDLAKESNQVYFHAAFHEEIGITYKKLNSSKKAEFHFKESMKIYHEYGFEEQYLFVVSELVLLYNDTEQYDLAVEYGTKGIEIANQLQVINDQSNLSLELAKAYEKIGQIPLALKYQKDHKKWSDSLSSTTKDEIILKLESDYQLSLLENKQIENEAIIKEQKQKNNIYILLLLLATIVSLFYWLNFKTKEKYSKSLEHKVAERTKDLKMANQDLSIANSELERFSYISAHDLKEHIRNIASFSSLLERESSLLNDKDIEKVNSYFEVVKTSTSSMSQLVEDILKYVSITKENIDQNVSLNRVIENIKDRKIMNQQLSERKIIYENLPDIKANNQHINLLFTELIENGFKFNNHQNPEVNISYSESENDFKIYIKDNGIGINEIYSKQAFTMFSRLHNRSEYQGSGLGLAIVNKIINILNGKVNIRNGEKLGATVELILPKNLKI